MFENLTNKFEEIFSSLKKAPSLDEAQVDEGLRGIRQALLEADVSLDVAKDFIEKVKPKALGQEIIRSTSPGDMVVKIVYDELVDLLGATNNEINLNAVPPVPMMLVGLQGSGKTTTTAKLAKFLENNKKKKVMMVSLDIYRPAAQEQLRSLGEQNNILTLPIIDCPATLPELVPILKPFTDLSFISIFFFSFFINLLQAKISFEVRSK